MNCGDIIQLEEPIYNNLDQKVGNFVWDNILKQFVPIDSAAGPIYCYISRSDFEDKNWDKIQAKLQVRFAKILGDVNIIMMMETQLDYAEDRERKENLHAMRNQNVNMTISQSPGSKFNVRHFI